MCELPSAFSLNVGWNQLELDINDSADVSILHSNVDRVLVGQPPLPVWFGRHQQWSPKRYIIRVPQRYDGQLKVTITADAKVNLDRWRGSITVRGNAGRFVSGVAVCRSADIEMSGTLECDWLDLQADKLHVVHRSDGDLVVEKLRAEYVEAMVLSGIFEVASGSAGSGYIVSSERSLSVPGGNVRLRGDFSKLVLNACGSGKIRQVVLGEANKVALYGRDVTRERSRCTT